jgi:hypothetical protein
MRFGIVYPGSDVHTLVAYAREAEAAGWDGYFVWDSVFGTDPWVALGAVASQTERIKIGTMLTPVSRRRPWKLACETMTVDQLSNGRLILAVGLGAPDTGFDKVGEVVDRKTRAQLLDEGLTILKGLWSGEEFSYSGQHYQVRDVTFAPTPVQQPHIPIWVVGAWPRVPSMQRVTRWDGVLPAKLGDDGTYLTPTPDDIRDMKSYIMEHRTTTTPFDIVMEGVTPGDDPEQARAILQPLADAGTTWWIESLWSTPDDATVLRRIRQGPPRIE